MEYSRNRIYISEKKQQQIKNFEILIGGCGIGSVIAECALRMGFEKISLVDGDKVEDSNLNRQNYTDEDILSVKLYGCTCDGQFPRNFICAITLG